MTQNPFDALGGGGFDMNALLQQAQQMQDQVQQAQERLAETVFDGTAGGVTVRATGTGDLVGVVFTPGSVDAADPEALEDLGDLVVAAFRDAKAKADAAAAEVFGPLTQGLGGGLGGGLPGGDGTPSPGQLGF